MNEDENDKPVVLLVDDDPDNLMVLNRPLMKAGYRLLMAQSGPEALDLLKTTRVDVILLDWMMPTMSGIDVLEKLNENDAWKLIPVIMVTAKSTSEDVRTGLAAGANDYITKPVDRIELLARISTCLRERQLNMELEKTNASLKELNVQLEARTEFIRETFGRYMSDEVVESLLETPQGLDIGGDKRVVTVMVTDLRGFSSISERLPPENVVEMLNTFFEAMIEVIDRYQGTICDFVGDAIMTVFGAPIQREDDSSRALACAIEMQKTMHTVNERNRESGLPELEMGVGINTGVVVAGNIGSSKRVKYGVVGSSVNLASRIETYTVGGQILVSESTLLTVEESVESGKRYSVNFKGINKPVELYEVFGIAGEYNLRLDETAEEFAAPAGETKIYFTTVEGKAVSGAFTEGRILKLSPREIVLGTGDKIELLSDLKLSLTGDAEQNEIFYGKILEKVDEPGGAYLVRLTSVSDDVRGKLGEVL